jgi:hypothetical protein
LCVCVARNIAAAGEKFQSELPGQRSHKLLVRICFCSPNFMVEMQHLQNYAKFGLQFHQHS